MTNFDNAPNLTGSFSSPAIEKCTIFFPYSLHFCGAFKSFEERDMFSTSDITLNQDIENFILKIRDIIESHIRQNNLPLVTEIDWRLEAEYPDGIRIETMQPILDILGTKEDIKRFQEIPFPDMPEEFDFSERWQTVLNEAEQIQGKKWKFFDKIKIISMWNAQATRQLQLQHQTLQ